MAPRHMEIGVGKDTAPELMESGRIFSRLPRCCCCAGSQRGWAVLGLGSRSQHGWAVPGLGSILDTTGQAAELGWTPGEPRQ